MRFQRAIDIMEDLDGRIRRARAKVDELAPRLEAISRAAADGTPAAVAGRPPTPDQPAPTYDYGDDPFDGVASAPATSAGQEGHHQPGQADQAHQN